MKTRMVALAATLVLAGCTAPQRIRPGAESWRTGVKRIGVLPAVRILEVSPGDVEELNEEWSAKGERTVAGAVVQGLRARGLDARTLSWTGDEELDDVRLLYAEVARAIWLYTYPPFAFPHKQEKFDYSVGPIDRVLARSGVDLLLVAAGGDRFDNEGERLSIRTGMRGMALLTMGLVDRQGNVIWFGVGGGRSVDLRDEAQVREAVGEMLSSLPGSAP